MYDEDVLPLWVADMDFPAPPAVMEALRERVDHGCFGYGNEPAELRSVVQRRMERLYGWSVREQDLTFLPGVGWLASTWSPWPAPRPVRLF